MFWGEILIERFEDDTALSASEKTELLEYVKSLLDNVVGNGKRAQYERQQYSELLERIKLEFGI